VRKGVGKGGFTVRRGIGLGQVGTCAGLDRMGLLTVGAVEARLARSLPVDTLWIFSSLATAKYRSRDSWLWKVCYGSRDWLASIPNV